MRCKPGDLAIVTKSYFGFEGAIVEVISAITEIHDQGGRADWNLRYRGSTKHPITGLRLVAEDNQLTPIRPGDLSEDEVTEKELTA